MENLFIIRIYIFTY